MFSATVLVPLLAAAQTTPTTGAAQETPDVPGTEVRLGLGLGLGRLDLAVSLLQDRLRPELGATWIPLTDVILEPSLSVRILGPAHRALWLRGGYLFQHIELECHPTKVDDAHAFDGGLAYRQRWPGGHFFAAEAGWEWLRRPGNVVCADSVMNGRSSGARVVFLGQWTFRPPFGLFLRVGLRSADHFPEIHVLPELYLGLSFEL